MLAPITIVGDETPGGAYVLRLNVGEDVAVCFGRFCDGLPIDVFAGEYLYVGSAMKGLGRRLLRHANRTTSEGPHSIRDEMLVRFLENGLVTGKVRPFTHKKLHWHIDYLLEHPAVTLSHVLIVCSQKRAEEAMARWLMEQPQTAILKPGLGAKDVPGNTHLLRVQADESWWLALPRQLLWLVEKMT